MRWVIRIGAAFALLVALALVALAILLPRIAQRPEVQERVRSAVLDATSHELRYSGLDVGLLPPRLELEGIELVSEAGEPTVAAERIALRVSVLPLLARAVVIDRIAIETPRLTLRRTEDGIEIPLRPRDRPKDDAAEAPSSESDEPASEDDGFRLAVRALELSDGQIELVDETLDPAQTWSLTRTQASLQIRLGEAAMPFALTARIGSGGSLSAKGMVAPSGAFEVAAEIGELALAPLQAHVDEGLRLAGSATLTAELSGTADAPEGPFRLEARDADIDLDGSFRKIAGDDFALAGRVSKPQGDWRIDELVLSLPGVEATGQAAFGKRTRLELSSPPVPIVALGSFLPALSGESLVGSVALESVRIATDPLELEGALVLDGLRREIDAGHEVVASGRFVGEGNRLAGRGLDLRVAEQPIALDLVVEDLRGTPELRLDATGKQLDSAKLMAAFTGDEERLSGPLDLDARLRLPLVGEGALRDRATGPISFQIAPGRLKGVSFLRSTFDQLGAAGAAAVEAGKGEKRLERFYDDEFERLGGTLRIANGIARSDDLRLDYRNYRVDLDGKVGLADQSLDCTGVLTIFEEVDQVLAEGAQAPADRKPRQRVIPLAHVGGTIDSPKISVTSDVAVRFAAAAYATDKRREKWEKKIDERLGEGSGREVIDLLDAILSGPPASDEEAP